MTPETPKTPEMISGKGTAKDSGNSGMYIIPELSEYPENRSGQPDPTQPVRDPLAHPNVIRIALSERATAALLACGEVFAIVGKGSYPTDPGRMVIYCQPCTMELANSACRILDGSHKATKIKTTV